MRASIGSLLLVLGLAGPASAQGLVGASPHQPPTDDKTGTNPLNLQHQVIVATTYVTLERFHLNETTYRHVVPILHRRVALSAGLPLVVGNLTGRRETGLGDVSANVEWTPWLSPRRGLLVGMRATIDTATVQEFGLGVHTLMPYVQVVFQPATGTILAPFLSYRTGMGGEAFATEVEDTLVGLYGVWRPTSRLWLATQPQVVFDAARASTYGELSAEVGYQWFSRLGAYVRPSVGVGADGSKPYAWGLTAGIRVIP